MIKITGNSRTYHLMKENMDINAGTIIDGQETINEVGQRVFDLMLEAARGRMTKSEKLSTMNFAITRLGLTI